MRRGLRRGAVVVVLLGYALLMVLQPLPRSVGEPLSWGVQTVTVLAAGTALLRRARRSTGRLRSARRLLVASLAAGAAGGVLAILWSLVTGSPPPDPSVVDLVHFCFLPLVVAGLLCFPVSDTRAGSSSRALLDGTVAAGALWFVAWALVLEPSRVGEGLPLAVRLTTLAYPAADVFVLGMLVSVLPRVSREVRRELAVIGSGLGLFAVADVAFTVGIARGTYRADSWIGVLYEAGLLLVLLGALRGDGQHALPRWSRLVTVLPHLPVLAAVGVAGGLAVQGFGVEAEQLGAGTVLVTALFLRQLVTGRDREALLERLQQREELFRSLVTGATDLITLHDRQGRVTWASPAVERVLGVPHDDMLGRSLGDLLDPADRVRLRAAFTAVARERGGRGEATVRVRAADGQLRWMQVQLHNELDAPGVQGIVGNTRDVHERYELERQLAHAAFHDALTGLGNLAQTRALLGDCYEAPRPATVVLVDLDGFKAVNDTFGHAHGDALLREVAERLTACVRAGDAVTRIGGDEFVLVLHGDDDAAPVCDRLLDQLRRPVRVAGTSITVRASLGVALTAEASDPDEVLRNADLAMYAAKAAGRDRATWYEPRMHEDAARRMALHHGLRRALDDDLLALHYQPIVRLGDGALVGAEALLRWTDPVHGPIPPDQFIPVAEESGTIGDIDVWVLDRACRDLAAWRAAGLEVPRLSVNVSRRHMTLDLPGLVRDTLQRHGLRGADLCIEVTESAVVQDVRAASAALAQVRALGVHVALDDFGSGESSLSQLARLPLDSVKIDRSFTQSATSDPVALRLLTSIVGVCQALALPVVAEGVEEAELQRFLARTGCQRGQGWHFGRPQPADDFRTRLSGPAVPAARTARDVVLPAEDVVAPR